MRLNILDIIQDLYNIAYSIRKAYISRRRDYFGDGKW